MTRPAAALLLLGAVGLLCRSAVAAPAAVAPTTCQLTLEGYGRRPGLKSADLSCNGAALTAAAHPVLQKSLSDTEPSGVQWSTEASCTKYIAEHGCFLAICQSSVTFRSPVVSNMLLNHTDDDTIPQLLCLGDDSTVSVHDGLFSNWHGSSADPYVFLVGSSSASLLISNSTFVRDRQSADSQSLFGGALLAYAGNITIISSSFSGTRAEEGGAILAQGQARIDVDPDVIQAEGARTTAFLNNAANQRGGDIAAKDAARVRVFGARLQGATAGNDSSIHISGNSTLELYDTTIDSATAKDSQFTSDPLQAGRHGGIGVGGNASLKMVRSTVSNCSAAVLGGGLTTFDRAQATLVDCTISGNQAGQQKGSHGIPTGLAGGIAVLDSSSLTLQDTRVISNRAWQGGAVMVRNSGTLTLQGDNTITQNVAWQQGGGVLLVSGTFSYLDLEQAARGNSAPNDPDIHLAADKLQVIDARGRSGNSTLQKFIPGDTLVLTLHVPGGGGRQSNESIVAVLFNAANVELLTVQVRFDRTKPRQPRKGNLLIRQPPGQYKLFLRTESPLRKNEKVLPLMLQVVPCPVGYVTDSTGDSCTACQRGYFSFDPQVDQCSLCPPNAQCNGTHSGAPQIWPAKDFWHSAPRSVQMHRCYNPQACAVKQPPTNATISTMSVSEYKTAQCSDAYEGNLCGNCKAGYGKVAAFVCSKCMRKPSVVMLYIAGVFVMMGVIKLMLSFETTVCSADREQLVSALPGELLKVMVLHGQWLWIISDLVGVPWPVVLSVPLNVVAGLWSSTAGSSIGFECVLPRSSRIPVGIQKELICLFTPVAIIGVIVAVEALLHCFSPKSRAAARDKLFGVTVCVIFLFFPTWLKSAFSLFTCVNLDKPGPDAQPPLQAEAIGSWWVHDMSQQCWSRTGYHRVWALGLGVPLLFLLCVVLPAAVVLFMLRSRQKGWLNDPEFVRHYGTLCAFWREGVCWWQAIVILQTIGLVMVATFGFTLGPYRQTLVICAVLGTVILLQLWVRPFACKPANHVAVASGCVLFVTAYSALSFLPYNNDSPGPVYSNIAAVVVILLNLGFLSISAWKLAVAVDWVTVKRATLTVLSRSATCGTKWFIRPTIPFDMEGNDRQLPRVESRDAVPTSSKGRDGKDAAGQQLPK